MISFKTLGYVNGNAPVPVEMIFDAEDPFAIKFVFYTSGWANEQQTWLFDKTLLDELESENAAGQGDVMFELDEEAHILTMQLTSNSGSAVVEFDPCSVEDFMDEVNASDEFCNASFEISDDMINALLNGEAA